MRLLSHWQVGPIGVGPALPVRQTAYAPSSYKIFPWNHDVHHQKWLSHEKKVLLSGRKYTLLWVYVSLLSQLVGSTAGGSYQLVRKRKHTLVIEYSSSLSGCTWNDTSSEVSWLRKWINVIAIRRAIDIAAIYVSMVRRVQWHNSQPTHFFDIRTGLVEFWHIGWKVLMSFKRSPNRIGYFFQLCVYIYIYIY